MQFFHKCIKLRRPVITRIAYNSCYIFGSCWNEFSLNGNDNRKVARDIRGAAKTKKRKKETDDLTVEGRRNWMEMNLIKNFIHSIYSAVSNNIERIEWFNALSKDCSFTDRPFSRFSNVVWIKTTFPIYHAASFINNSSLLHYVSRAQTTTYQKIR